MSLASLSEEQFLVGLLFFDVIGCFLKCRYSVKECVKERTMLDIDMKAVYGVNIVITEIEGNKIVIVR